MTNLSVERMKALEYNSELIESQLNSAAFGKSKIIYLPLVVAIGCLFFIGYVLFDGLTETVSVPTLLILAAVVVTSIIAMVLIFKKDKAALKRDTKTAMVCFAQKIFGNDREQVYSGIYTTGNRRHDDDFIRSVKEKIINLQPNTKEERAVADLFRPDFIKPGEFAKMLPLSFTNNIPVYRKQFSFVPISKNIKDRTDVEDGLFVVAALREENAWICKLFYQ